MKLLANILSQRLYKTWQVWSKDIQYRLRISILKLYQSFPCTHATTHVQSNFLFVFRHDYFIFYHENVTVYTSRHALQNESSLVRIPWIVIENYRVKVSLGYLNNEVNLHPFTTCHSHHIAHFHRQVLAWIQTYSHHDSMSC